MSSVTLQRNIRLGSSMMAARPVARSVNLRGPAIFLLLIGFLPQMPGTPYKDSYVYLLALYLGILAFKAGVTIPRHWPIFAWQVAVLGGTCVAIYGLSVCTSTVPAVSGDYFQFLREAYPFFVTLCSACI